MSEFLDGWSFHPYIYGVQYPRKRIEDDRRRILEMGNGIRFDWLDDRAARLIAEADYVFRLPTTIARMMRIERA